MLSVAFLLANLLGASAARAATSPSVTWSSGDNGAWTTSSLWLPQHEPCADEAALLLAGSVITLAGTGRAARVHFSTLGARVTFAVKSARLSADNASSAQAECMRLAPTATFGSSGAVHLSWEDVAAVYEVTYNGKNVATDLMMPETRFQLTADEDNHRFDVIARRADGRHSAATLEAQYSVLPRQVAWRPAEDGMFSDTSRWDSKSIPCSSTVVLPPLTTSMYTVRLRSAVLLLGMVFNGGRLALNEPGARIALRTASAPVTCDVATTAAPPTTPIPASPFTVIPDTSTSIRIKWKLGDAQLDPNTEISAHNVQTSLTTRTTVPANVNATAVIIHGLIAGDVYTVAVAGTVVARVTMPLERLTWASAEAGAFSSTMLWTRQGVPVSRPPCPAEHLLLSATATSPFVISVYTKAIARSLTFSRAFARVALATSVAQLSLSTQAFADSDNGQACLQGKTTSTPHRATSTIKATTTTPTTTTTTTNAPAQSTLRGSFTLSTPGANITTIHANNASNALQRTLTAAVSAVNGMELPTGLSLVPTDVVILPQSRSSDALRRRATSTSVTVSYTLVVAFEHRELVFCAMRSAGSPAGTEGALAVAIAAETELTALVADTVVEGCDACRCFYAPLPCADGLMREGGRCRTTDVSCPNELFLLSSGACQDLSTGVISSPSCAAYPGTRTMLLPSDTYVCEQSVSCSNRDLVYSAPDAACRFRVTPDCPAAGHVINTFGLCVPANVPCPPGTVYDLDELRPSRDSPLLDGCLDINECAADVPPCVSAASCTNEDTGFSCTCPAGSSGDGRVNGTGCQTYCNALPCRNGGSCVIGRDTYVCRCPNGFAGKNCETAAPCMAANGVCSGHGTCNNGTCSCERGYTGLHCDTAAACEDSPCANGGTCRPASNGKTAVCTCPAGFAGPTCTADLAACFIVRSPCSARGVCAPAASGGFSCTCDAGSGGERCNTTLSSDGPGSAASSSAAGTAAVAAGAAGGAVVLAVVVLLLVQRRRNGSGAHKQVYKTSRKCAVREVERHRLRMGGKLGSGAFGDVYVAWLKPAGRGARGGSPEQLCAVKMVAAGATRQQESEFRAEVQLMSLLGDGHPHVLSCLGYCLQGQPLLLLLEICEQGNLRDYLRNKVLPVAQAGVTAALLDSLVKYALEIASGMAHLAQRGIVHRDLAARNVLLTRAGSIKIADFGLAREAEDDVYMAVTARCLPIRWMAPEVLGVNQNYTTQSDVWSFGVTCYEIFSSGMRPYADIATGKEVMRHVRAGERLVQPALCPEPVYAMMNDTWSVDPVGRPSFAVLTERLHAIRRRGERQLLAELPQGSGTGVPSGDAGLSAFYVDKNEELALPCVDPLYLTPEAPETGDEDIPSTYYTSIAVGPLDSAAAATTAIYTNPTFGFFNEPDLMADYGQDNGEYDNASHADNSVVGCSNGPLEGVYHTSWHPPRGEPREYHLANTDEILPRTPVSSQPALPPRSTKPIFMGGLSGRHPARLNATQVFDNRENVLVMEAGDLYGLPEGGTTSVRFYHGALSRAEANALLLNSGLGQGAFLLRNSSSGAADKRALSVLFHGRVVHHMLASSSDGWKVNGQLAVPRAATVEALVSRLREANCGGGVLPEPLGQPVEVAESYDA